MFLTSVTTIPKHLLTDVLGIDDIFLILWLDGKKIRVFDPDFYLVKQYSNHRDVITDDSVRTEIALNTLYLNPVRVQLGFTGNVDLKSNFLEN